MSIDNLIQQYQERIQKLQQAEQAAFQIRGEQFYKNCQIWLGQFWEEFNPAKNPNVSSNFMSLSLVFEDITGEIKQELSGNAFLIFKKDKWSKAIDLPWNQWGKDRYPTEISQNAIVQAIIEARSLNGTK